MNVKQLKELLDCFDDEDELYFQYHSGDYWGTTLAKPIRNLDYAEVVHSVYHNCLEVPDESKLDRIKSKPDEGREKIHHVLLFW
jgi:hypothetical protein